MPLWWIVRKDLAAFFADRKGAVLIMVVPVILGLFMATLFNPGKGPSPLRLAVVDEDGGPAVAQLIARLDAEPALQTERLDAATARDELARGKRGVALHIPPGTDAQLAPASLFAGGERGALDLWVDPSRVTESDIVSGLVTKAMMETVFAAVSDPASQRKMFDDLRRGLGSGADRPELRSFLDQGVAFADENAALGGEAPAPAPVPAPKQPAGGLQPPLDLRREAIVAAGRSAGFHSEAHTFAGMLMQFLLFSAAGHAKTLFAERDDGTLDRVRMTAARPWQILVGTAISVAIIALIATAVVFGIGVFAFGVPLRSGLPAFALVALGQAAFLGGFVLFLVGVTRSDKQVDAISTLLILILCFISGAWVPPFLLPGVLQQIGPALPTRWVLDGMAGATWRGLGLGHALQATGVLWGFAALGTLIGVRRFRWG